MEKFIMNLIKGFFRSIVNQVGRDTGRKLSVKIFNRNKK